MQKIQLAIPEPCHENWRDLTPTDQGRFCSSCAKEVVDLSMMTDTEVLNYFSSLTYDKVCGRVLPSQLNRNITMPVPPKKRLFWYWNYIVMFFMFFSKSNLIKAQTKGEVITVPVKPQACTPTVGTMVAGIKSGPSIKINLKITDEKEAVPFASIKVKGSNVTAYADRNGEFPLHTQKGAILQISAEGYNSATIDITDQKTITVILKRRSTAQSGEVVVVYAMGGLRRPRIVTEQRYSAIFEVKDSETGLPLNKASFIVSNISSSKSDSGFADNKGVYKLIRAVDDSYDVRIMAEGYEASEFSISSKEFNERKEPWQVLLKKKVVEKPLPNMVRTSLRGESAVQLGGMVVVGIHRDPIYVLDGIIIPSSNDINPDDIESITVLRGPAAAALYGPQGMYGAIVMVSKRSIVSKVKTLDTIKVAAYPSMVVGKLMTYRTTTVTRVIDSAKNETKNIIGDTKQATAVQIAIYPNPVNRGNLFALALQLKEKGEHRIQIANTGGEVLLQKRVNAVNLSQKEMIQCDSRWSGGVYYVSVFDNKNQLINRSSFIVQ